MSILRLSSRIGMGGVVEAGVSTTQPLPYSRIDTATDSVPFTYLVTTDALFFYFTNYMQVIFK